MKIWTLFYFSALIPTPAGKFNTPIIDDNQDGTVSIQYQPSEVGSHQLDVFCQGQPIAGSPFKFHVDQVQSGYVSAEGRSKAEIQCNDNKDGTCDVTYWPVI